VPATEAGNSRPQTPDGRKAFLVTPFQRLARTHFISAMADAMVAVSLADTLFFSLPADSARAPVVRYLLITMLPFAVIAPLVGPLIDRLKGGHRFMVIGSAVVRAVLCWLMIGEINSGGAPFFLLALCVLVSQRAYQVARSALVPTVVTSDDELIEANSKLAMISGLAGFIGVVPSALLNRLAGPGWALGLALLTYLAASIMATRIPPARVATSGPDETERHELRGAGIVLAGSAMGLLRMSVGFLTLLIAFDFRGVDRRPWEFALVGAVSVASGLTGAALAPKLKQRFTEEHLLTGALTLVASGAFFSLFIGEVLGAAIVGSCVGFAAALGKLSFDSILQRDAPDANRGRSFARFETRFQVSYVIGAFIPVAINMGARVGFAILLAVAAFATGSYILGRMAWAHRTGTRQTAATAAAAGIEDRFAEVSGEVKGRLAAGPRRVMHRIRRPEGSDDDGRDDGDRGPGPEAGLAAPPDRVSGEGLDHDPAGRSRVAWHPDAPTHRVGGGAAVPLPPAPPAPVPPSWVPPTSMYPWEPEPEPPTPGADYLDDLDPTVHDPFPWADGPPSR
jgi:hypothetical protein